MSALTAHLLRPQYATWPENASNIHHVVDTRRPWVPSPEAEQFPLPVEHAPDRGRPVIPSTYEHHRHALRTSRTRNIIGRDRSDPFAWRSSRSWFSSLWRRWFGKEDPVTIQEDAEKWPGPNEGHIVKPAEWRAYGYWARPNIDGIIVRNATPPPAYRRLSRQEVELVFRNLHITRNSGNWLARQEHPALPPRPSLWTTPPQTPTPLPPSKIQLNPFLQHRVTGRSPLLFDMRSTDILVFLGEEPPEAEGEPPVPIPLYIDGPNGAQPATYPPVSSLYISALADDTCARFPWPFLVLPHHPDLPVQVKDVLSACIADFEERMTMEEAMALSEERREQVCRAYWDRVGRKVQGRVPSPRDGLRRIDYLGDRAYFRGLEPAPDGVGFMLFVGPP